MPVSDTRPHQWVKHTVVPIDILPSLGVEAFTTSVDPTKLEAAEEAAVFGCAACSLPLNDDTVQTFCFGSDPGLDGA